MSLVVSQEVQRAVARRSRLRFATSAALSLLLGACASVSSVESPEAAAAPTAGAAQTTPAPVNIPETQVEVVDNQQLVDDINREGRVIQLGRFVEAAPPVTPPANDVVELNFEQEDLRLVLEQLGEALNLTMVIDPTIDNKVSLRTAPGNPLTYADIWPLMRTLARNAGITIEQVGNVYEFIRNASTIPTEILLPGDLGAAASGEVLQVTPLTYISIEAAETILNPLLQPAGSIIRLGPANLLGISGSPEQLSRINALLDVIDDDPFLNQGIQLYELENSQAPAVAEELTGILKLIEGEFSSYQVLGLERINAIMVVAPANRGFDEVSRWVRILDAESQEQVEQLFVYRVKNLTATTLAETLTNVFGEPGEANPQTEREEDPDPPGNESRPAVPEALPQEAPPAPAPTVPAAPALDAGSASTIVSADLSVTIVADEDTNSLLVRASPREYRQLLTTISSLDTVPPQVLINAVIGQVNLTDSTAFGIDWTRVSSNAASGPARLTSRFLPDDLFNDAGDLVTGAGSGLILTRTFMDGSAVIDATLQAIATDNDVRLLARPTLLATNNQEGEIKVGQRVPVNNGVSQTLQGQMSNIAYQDVGIVLTITPRINDDGFISLEIFQSLSSVQQGTEGVGDNPTFTNQEVTTVVVVSDQSTITLGGLIQDDISDNSSGIPVLNKIPVLGALFGYQEFSNERRELFIILRPQIIRGDGSDNAVLQEFRTRFTNVENLLKEAGL